MAKHSFIDSLNKYPCLINAYLLCTPSFIHASIPSVTQHLLSTYCVPSTVLGVRDPAVEKVDQISAIRSRKIEGTDTGTEQIRMMHLKVVSAKEKEQGLAV